MNRFCLLAILWACVTPIFSKTLFFQNDTVPPVVVCPMNDTVVLAPGACFETVTYTVSVSDDNPGVVLTQTAGLPSGSNFPWGVTTNNFTATDTAGNTSSCSFQLTLEQELSFLSCVDYLEVALDDDCNAVVTAEMLLDQTTILGCSTALVVAARPFSSSGFFPLPPVFDADDAGNLFLVRVRDTLTGNSCWMQVLIVGRLPELSCTNLTLPCFIPDEQLSPAFLRDSFAIVGAFPDLNDGCGDEFTLNYADLFINGSCDSTFARKLRRTWTVTDNDGNTRACQQTIYLENNELEGLVSPNDTTLLFDCNANWDSTVLISFPYAVFSGRKYPLNTFSCILGGAQRSDSIVSTCGGSREVWRIFDLINWCAGEFKTDTQRIVLPDLAPPVLVCDSLRIFEAGSTGCSVLMPWPDVPVSDVCSGVTDVQVWWESNGDTTVQVGLVVLSGGDTVGRFNETPDFPAGQTLVTYEAFDECGLLGSCSQWVQVWDNTPPTVECKTTVTVYLASAIEQNLPVSALVETASDDCAPVTFKVRRNTGSICDTSEVWTDALRLCCAELNDPLSVSVRAYDVPVPPGIVSDTFAVAQSATCQLTVVVLDTVSLHCIAPPDTVVSCFGLGAILENTLGLMLPCSVDTTVEGLDFSDYDSLCGRGIVVRTFTVTDAFAATSQCVQMITVQGTDRNFAVRFPNDVILSSCASAASPILTGRPLVLNNACSLLDISFQDVVFTVAPDACLKVERIWTVLDLCLLDSTNQPVVVPNPMPNAAANSFANLPGPVVSAPGTLAPWTSSVVKINATDPGPTDYSMFWNDSIAGFIYTQSIKIIEIVDPSFAVCEDTSLLFRDSSGNDLFYWNDLLLEPLPVQGNRPEMPVALSATGFETCPYQDITFRSWLYLDLDDNGSQETVVFSPLLMPPGEVRYDNSNSIGFTGGTPLVFDKRPVPDSLKYSFVLQLVVIDSLTHTTQARWWWQSGTDLIDPEFPHGKHRVKWIIEDGCGNEKVCEFEFTIQDGIAPVLDCKDTVRITMQPSGTVSLHPEDVWLTDPVDNLTDIPQMVFGLNNGTVTQLPLDSLGQPVVELVYTCYDDVFNLAQLWAQDEQRNETVCTFVLEILDIPANCLDDAFVLGGRIATYGGRGIVQTNVLVDAEAPVDDADTVSVTDGRYQVGFSASGVQFTIIPSKGGDALNGISTFDLVLINSHILNIMSFDTPYKIIAADANNSRSVTTADIAVLRRLILGIQDTLPGLRSWVFVDSVYVFPNPDNPFTPVYPTSITAINPPGDQLWHNFIGVKIGDVNDNADVDSLVQQQADDRKPLPFTLQDRYVETGEIFNLHLAPQTDVTACQFTLNYPGLECLGITPDAGLTAEHAAVFAEKNKITVSNDVGGKTGFDLQMRALKNGFLSEKLNITSDITPAEAWTASGEKLVPQLVFRKNEATASLTAQPTVFSDQTVLSYTLPTETKATLLVYNASGQLLFQQTVSGAAGEHQFVLNAAMVKHSKGQMTVQLRTLVETLNVKLSIF